MTPSHVFEVDLIEDTSTQPQKITNIDTRVASTQTTHSSFTFPTQSNTMVRALIVGATRGLGASLTKQYASKTSSTVFATTRSSVPKDFPENVKWLSGVDLQKPKVGDELAGQLKGEKPLDLVVSTAVMSIL